MSKSGDNIKAKNASWSFDGSTYKNFDKHINKSVPLYQETHDLYLDISDFFLQDNSKIIDIGSSTGTFLINFHKKHNKTRKGLKFEGYDTIKKMITYSNQKKPKKNNIKFTNKDINKVDFKNSCIISSFYTIQFISPKKRQALLNKIYKNLNWGGAFFMVEKVRGSDARFQDIISQVYLEYKLSKGYKADEILNKSRSLKGVLEPFSTNANLQMLKRSGFKDIFTVFKYCCFEGWLAIK
ncbi:methyltransferase domain-containing protein [Candidatus Pelagibacter sp.]|jgi:tRNA (cmo5U34)-methyltransferase|nr:methyltransferase domain-containing protein [Candidatus Pelagibacter sp.]